MHNSYYIPTDYQKLLVGKCCNISDEYGRIVLQNSIKDDPSTLLYIILRKLNIDYQEVTPNYKNVKINNLSDEDIKIYLKSKRKLGKRKERKYKTTNILIITNDKKECDQYLKYLEPNCPEGFHVASIKTIFAASSIKNKFLEDHINIIVIQKNICLDTFRHGFMKIENIFMMVFNECQDAFKKDPYNLIMKEFYFYDRYYNRNIQDTSKCQPFILGLLTYDKISINHTQDFKINMGSDQYLKQLQRNLNSKLIDIEENILSKTNYKFRCYCMENYKECIKLNKEFLFKIPKIYDVFDRIGVKDFETTFEGLQNFENDIISQLSKINFEIIERYDLNPDKMSQIIGEHFKDFLFDKINLSEFQEKIQPILVFIIIYYKHCLNIILNIGVGGLKIFIKDFLSHVSIMYQYIYENTTQIDWSKFINDYTFSWNEFSKKIEFELSSSLSPKFQALLDIKNLSSVGHLNTIYVGQRVISNLMESILTPKADSCFLNISSINECSKFSLKSIMEKLCSNKSSTGSNLYLEGGSTSKVSVIYDKVQIYNILKASQETEEEIIILCQEEEKEVIEESKKAI